MRRRTRRDDECHLRRAPAAGLPVRTDRIGLARCDEDTGVRWIAVRHAEDHVHIVATLARQDGRRPRLQNDRYRSRRPAGL